MGASANGRRFQSYYPARICPGILQSKSIKKGMIQTNELIPINYDSDRPTVSAKGLHQFLGIDTRFNVWFPRMAMYGFAEDVDYARLSQKCDTPGGQQNTVDYQLTIDMAKELCMIQRTERGKEARQYFIKVENDWNDPAMVMARALKMADTKIKRLETQAEEDKPKVLFANSVAGSKTSILIRDLAKLISQNGYEIGEKRLFEWMRRNGYLISKYGRDYNSPTQKSMKMGLMEVKETAIAHTNGTQTAKTPLITGKGQQYFINKFMKIKEVKEF
jgi:anti-repressor protein